MHYTLVEDIKIDSIGINKLVGDLIVIILSVKVDVGEGEDIGLLIIIVVVEDGVAELQIASPATLYN
jgi:hypothetical protein